MFNLLSFSIVAGAVLIAVCEGQLSICEYDRLVLGQDISTVSKFIGSSTLYLTNVTFVSPSSSENISNTEECLLLVSGEGSIIQMNVKTFDLGGQEPCDRNVEHLSILFYKYYEPSRIRNGYPSPGSGRKSNRGHVDTILWCGQSYSRRLETREHMIIKYFAGPETQRGKGFELSFSREDRFKCGSGEEVIGDQPMYIYSPGYPAVYDKDVDNYGQSCSWDLKSHHKGPLLLETQRFALEYHVTCGYDFLQINGEKYCGSQKLQISSRRDTFNIVFYTDRSVQLDGFVLKIVALQKDVATCGQHVNATTSPKILQLPSISPGHYFSVHCWWLVDAGRNDHVVLLENMRFHTSASCDEFELRVYDGKNQTIAKRILSTCAPEQMFQAVRSSSRFLYIDIDIHVTGTVVTTINVTYMVTAQHRDATPRQLYAGFAKSYIWLNLATWNDLGLVIRGNDEDVGNYSSCLELSLEEFPTRSSLYISYFFYIFSGWNASYAELGSACGRSWSKVISPSWNKVISRGSKVYIVLRPNLNTTIQSVRLIYRLQKQCEPETVPLLASSEMNHTVMVDHAYTSPRPASLYDSMLFPRNLLCLWLIHPQNSSFFVKATTQSVYPSSLTCSANITAYDYSSESGFKNKMLEWCYNKSPVVLSSKGNSLLLRFASDSERTDRIFNIRYSSVLLVNQCPSMAVVVAEKISQYLTSPNYPYNYPNGIDCRWRIHAKTGVVKLSLMNVYIASEGTVCSLSDFLVIYDGWDRSGRVLKDLCSNITGGIELVGTGAYMMVHFHSNSRGTSKGFLLKYQAAEDRSLYGTVYVTDNEDRQISSPHYPQPYPGNTESYWQVQAALTHVVMLEVMELDLPCASPVVLYDGPSDKSLMMASLCGERYRRQYVSTQKSMFIRFRSTSNVGYKGFQFRLRSWKGDGACMGDVQHLMAYTSKRYISSPRYPADYPSQSECKWRIESAYRNMSVLLQIEDAKLQDSESCQADSLTVHDGYGEGSPSLGKFCGSHTEMFVSSEIYLFLVFVSDKFGGDKGFLLSYKVTPHPPASPSPDLQEGSNSGAIIGGVMGGVTFFLVGITAFLCFLRRHVRSRSSSSSSSPPSSSQSRQIPSHRQRAGSTVFVMNPVIVNQMAPPPPYPGLANTSFTVDDQPPAYVELSTSVLPPVHLDAPPSYSETMLESHPPSSGPPTPRARHSASPSQGAGSREDALPRQYVDASRGWRSLRGEEDVEEDYQRVSSASSGGPHAGRQVQGDSRTRSRHQSRRPQDEQRLLDYADARGYSPSSPHPHPHPHPHRQVYHAPPLPPQHPTSQQPPPPPQQHRASQPPPPPPAQYQPVSSHHGSTPHPAPQQRPPHNSASHPRPPPSQPSAPPNSAPEDEASHSSSPYPPPPPPLPQNSPPGQPSSAPERWSPHCRPAQEEASSSSSSSSSSAPPRSARRPDTGMSSAPFQRSEPEVGRPLRITGSERDAQHGVVSTASGEGRQSPSPDRVVRLESIDDIGTTV